MHCCLISNNYVVTKQHIIYYVFIIYPAHSQFLFSTSMKQELVPIQKFIKKKVFIGQNLIFNNI